MPPVRVLPILALLAVATSVAPATLAGSEEAPEVTDAAGDAGPQNTPTPAGSEWADFVAAWFSDETPEDITMTMKVTGTDVAPPNSVIGLLFRVGDQYFIAGYGDFAIPFPPFRSQGGYLCPADASGTPEGDGGSCGVVPYAFAAGVYTIGPLSRSSLGAGPGALIEAPIGQSGYLVSVAAYVPIDETPEGFAYAFAPAEAPPVPADPADLAPPTVEDGAPQGDRATPVPSIVVVLALALALAPALALGLARSRR
ncbi:MAG: hypothetical protein ACT4PT_03585 [Methanobacteriota archaeon]